MLLPTEWSQPAIAVWTHGFIAKNKSASVSHRGGFAFWSYGTRKSSGYFLNLLPGVVVVHVMTLLFPYTANIYAHVMESADRKNADILADVFLKKAWIFKVSWTKVELSLLVTNRISCKSCKNIRFLYENGCFSGCGGRTRTYGLRVMRQSQAQIGAISAPICAFYHHSFGGFSIVSVQSCPIFSCSGSKLGQAWGFNHANN